MRQPGLPLLPDPHDGLPQAVRRLHRQHAARPSRGRDEGGPALHQRRLHQGGRQVRVRRLLLLISGRTNKSCKINLTLSIFSFFIVSKNVEGRGKVDRRKPFPPFYFLSLLSEGGRERDVCWLEKGYEFLFLCEKKAGSRGRGKNEIKKWTDGQTVTILLLFSVFSPLFAGLFLAFACSLFRRFSAPGLANNKQKAFVSPLFSCGNFLFENISEHPLICLEKFF